MRARAVEEVGDVIPKRIVGITLATIQTESGDGPASGRESELARFACPALVLADYRTPPQGGGPPVIPNPQHLLSGGVMGFACR